jgi:hypothetical protein
LMVGAARKQQAILLGHLSRGRNLSRDTTTQTAFAACNQWHRHHHPPAALPAALKEPQASTARPC